MIFQSSHVASSRLFPTTQVIYNIIDERRKELEGGGGDVPQPSLRTDLLQSLLTAVDDSGQGVVKGSGVSWHQHKLTGWST